MKSSEKLEKHEEEYKERHLFCVMSKKDTKEPWIRKCERERKKMQRNENRGKCIIRGKRLICKENEERRRRGEKRKKEEKEINRKKEIVRKVEEEKKDFFFSKRKSSRRKEKSKGVQTKK